MDSLLGIEGQAARFYFEHFNGCLKASDATGCFDFEGRNRRPPRDPVNALLSLAYAMLAKDLAVVANAVGFDPMYGFFHQPRFGRPALALDLMEEFRPLIADSTVLFLINNKVVRPEDFIIHNGSCALTDGGRAKFFTAYERRKDTLVTHPIFGYRLSYQRMLEVQARLLARVIQNELPAYPGFTTR
jgi:CRISPR-associated protein Cas1